VLAAEQERDKRISEARGYTNSLISLAQGEASVIVSKGQSDRVRLLQSLAADASAFTNYLVVYERNPEMYHQILLTESWQRILTNAQEKFFLPDRADGASREMRITVEPRAAETVNRPDQSGAVRLLRVAEPNVKAQKPYASHIATQPG